MQHNGFLVLGLHSGEQDNLPNRIGAGEEHDGAVDAHAHAARGGHAVFQRGEEILIQHLCLVVALQRHHNFLLYKEFLFFLLML